MNRRALKCIAVLLTAMLLLSCTACGSQNEKPVDVQRLFQALLTDVEYASALTLVEENAELFFLDLPEATVTMYDASGYYADELVLITVSDPGDLDAALDSVQTHIAELRTEFQNYIPEEVAKIKDAILWSGDGCVILCITDDWETAQRLIANPPVAGETVSETPTEDTTQAPVSDTTEDPVTDTTETTAPDTTQPPTDPPEESTEAPTEAATEAPTEATYEPIISKSGTYTVYGDGVYLVDNMAYEGYNYSKSAAKKYTALVNRVAESLAGEVNIYSMVIPTAIGVLFPDDLKRDIYWINQQSKLDLIYGMMDESIIPVNCFTNLMDHRDEYIYFRTDWHWNGPGAYYAYETFCQVKGITPYTMEQREKKEFSNFLGAHYWVSCEKDPALEKYPDKVIAYLPYSPNVVMEVTDEYGNVEIKPVIRDVSKSKSSLKYGCFAGGDEPMIKFTNPDVTDGSVLVVVKESFGNALMSYLVDHYSIVYEIDYRHWKGDLAAFCQEVGATDLLFANNIGMVRSSFLIGQLDKIIS